MADYQFNTNLGPAPQQGTSLGDLINTARAVQAYQQSQQINPLEVQAKQMAIEQAQQLNPLAVQQKQMEIEQAQKLNPLAVRKSTAETGTAELGLNQRQALISHEMFGGLRNDPDILNASKDKSAAVRKIMQFETLIENAGVPKQKIAPVSKFLMDEAINNPEKLISHIDSLIQSGVGASGQQSLQTPAVTTNAAGQLVRVQPLANKVNVLGESPEPVSPSANKMPVNPSQSQVGLANKATEVAGADYTQTVADSSGAQGRIATFQNIKRLAPEAFTGVGGERKKLVSGIAQAVGIPAYELETSSTDELSKNTKLLALTGGNTDAARGIAELASPNAKMTKDAINRVADQLIGIEKMKLAKTQFLSPYINNPAEYGKKLMEWGNVADFRIFQESTPEEVKKLKESMTPAARREMSEKVQMARKLGIIQ